MRWPVHVHLITREGFEYDFLFTEAQVTVDIEELMTPASQVSTVWFNHGMKGFYLLNYFNVEDESVDQEWMRLVLSLEQFSDADIFGILATL